jgi:undecaprenyl-diphosphatase
MPLYQIIILAIVQGFAELLPVSSSAHVIVAEKLLGLDPTTPGMTLFLVLLHTGTMFSVIVYFWSDWARHYFQTSFKGIIFVKQVLLATLVTGVVGLGLKMVIEKVFMRGAEHAEVEMLFGNFKLISIALASVGLLILWAASRESESNYDAGLGPREAIWIGLVQGLCLPFRGFSRSGATISTGILLKLSKAKAEEFSFALAVVLTPPVVLQEIHRALKAHAAVPTGSLSSLFMPGLIGMVLSFAAGLLALKWLSSWLSHGRWKYFGFYCLAFAGVVWLLK